MQYPDWVMEAKKSRELLSWIQDPVHSIKKFHSQLFIKCQEENCMLFYAASAWRDCLQLRKPKLCSILYLPDYSLYEADSVFYQAVGIPADFLFPTKESLKKEVEMKVTHLVKNMMDTNWDQLLLKYQHQRSSLVPNINRIQVEETSKRFLEAGIKPEELFYSPSFTFEKAQMEYTDVMFFYTLNHAKKAVKMIADKWLSESFWEISQKRIYIGCVREEMKELQKGAA